MTTPEDAASATEALARFMDVVAREPEARKAFLKSPDQTLEELGISGLGAELLGFLKALSGEELAFLARLNRTLIRHGIAGEYNGITLAHL